MKSRASHQGWPAIYVYTHKTTCMYQPPLCISQIAELSEMREDVMSRVQAAIDQAEVYRSSHASRSHLWTDDRHEFLRQFLKYGHVPTEEEIEAAGTCTCTFVHIVI